jgi:hypothetical protein
MPACPMACLPNEMRSLFHRGGAYSSGVVFVRLSGLHQDLGTSLRKKSLNKVDEFVKSRNFDFYSL